MKWSVIFRVFTVIALILATSLSASAQPDEWTVNPNAYQFTMSLTFTVNIDGWVGGDDDVVAFFDGDGACRGVGSTSYLNPSNGWYTGLMLVYSNQSSGLAFTAMIWDSSESLVLDSDDLLSFVSDDSIGTFGEPIIISAISNPFVGCMDSEACNFLPTAVIDDGGCVYPGCGDVLACNYMDNADCLDTDLCAFPEYGLDCEGNCLDDFDSDGVCDENEVVGCSDSNACNFDETVTDDNCSCFYPIYPLDCEGNCFLDINGDGVCDGFEILGCDQPEACNFDASATEDDGSCDFCCFGLPQSAGYSLDVDSETDIETGLTRYRVYAVLAQTGDRVIQIGGVGEASLIITSTSFYQHPSGGAMASSITPEGLISEPNLLWDSWVTIGLDQVASLDGEIDAMSEGSSVWSTLFELGENIYLVGGSNDGWSVAEEATNSFAGDDLRVLLGQWTTDGYISGQIEVSVIPFGTSSPIAVLLSFTGPECGCTEPSACNFDLFASWDDGSCVFQEAGYDCVGNCLQDGDSDGICDADEVMGCVNENAFNYQPSATQDDGSCLLQGCTYPDASNYDSEASIDNQSCIYNPVESDSCPDLNADGTVGSGDLILFLSSFGLPCEG